MYSNKPTAKDMAEFFARVKRDVEQSRTPEHIERRRKERMLLQQLQKEVAEDKKARARLGSMEAHREHTFEGTQSEYRAAPASEPSDHWMGPTSRDTVNAVESTQPTEEPSLSDIFSQLGVKPWHAGQGEEIPPETPNPPQQIQQQQNISDSDRDHEARQDALDREIQALLFSTHPPKPYELRSAEYEARLKEDYAQLAKSAAEANENNSLKMHVADRIGLQTGPWSKWRSAAMRSDPDLTTLRRTATGDARKELKGKPDSDEDDDPRVGKQETSSKPAVVPPPMTLRRVRFKNHSLKFMKTSTLSQLFSEQRGSDVLLSNLLANLDRLDLSENIEVGELKGIGGYADVYDGWAYVGEHRRMRVAVKRFRVMMSQDFAKSVARELGVWAGLEHRNVLPLLGFLTVDGTPSLVSEWMNNGNVKDYMARHPDTDIVHMTSGIAEGLAYLHKKGAIHSDLKSDNIFVSADGTPLLADFGISRLLIESTTVAGTTSLKGNVRWMAVELIDPERTSSSSPHMLHTKATDVWAFGMVVYELLSNNIPFYLLMTEVSVLMAIISGRMPTKPTWGKHQDKQRNALWKICVSCWASKPEDRPVMSSVAKKLGKL